MWPHLNYKNPYPRVLKFTSLENHSSIIITMLLVYLNHAQSTCIEEGFKRNIAILLYDLNGHALALNPYLGGHGIYNFGRHFLGHHNNILSFFYVW